MKKEILYHVFWIIGIIFIAFFIFNSIETSDMEEMISVSGNALLHSQPDQAVVILGYEVLKDTAAEAQTDNEKVILSIKNDLLEFLDSSKIETSSFYLNEYKEWIEDSYIFKGYKASHILQVTCDIDSVSKVISTATSNGANYIGSVSYELSEAKMNEVRSSGYSEAMANAKSKADSIMSVTNQKVGNVILVSESSMQSPVYYEAKAMASDAFSPKEVDVTVNLQVNFELK